MRLTRVVGITVLTTFLFAGVAFAGYVPTQDKTVSVNVLPGIVTTSGSTGSLTFAAQEAVHSAVTQSSGTSVNHYYFWIYVNGQPVAAVDPLSSPEWQ